MMIAKVGILVFHVYCRDTGEKSHDLLQRMLLLVYVTLHSSYILSLAE
jgi:hypothetical protein